MKSQLSSVSLTTARSIRLSILANIEDEMKRLSIQEDFLKKSLLEVAPAPVKKFLGYECIIELLFKYGQVSLKIAYLDNSYGFKNAKHVKRVFRALKKAWQNAVEITFSDGEPHRIVVSIKIP